MLILLMILAGVSLAGCSPSSAPPSVAAERQPVAAMRPAPPRIVQFYASPDTIPKGEKSLLCYGVENTKTLELTPAVDKVWPAMSRCIDVRPVKATTYTLKADSADGQSVSQSVTVQVGPPAPKILSVSVNSLEVKAGEVVTVCYKTQNATSVKLSPGNAAGLQSLAHGCITDAPKETTTYTVIASGAAGQSDTEKVTVKVH